MKPRVSTARLGWALILLHLRGWRQRPGYTVAEREQDGSLYIAIHLDPP